MADQPLGRRIPTDWRHVERYPIRLLTDTQTQPTGVPVALGINWYTAFDRPELINGRYWVGRDPNNLGSIRGGHCVCIKPSTLTDPLDWWAAMDQGNEGACVDFGSTRMMMLMNRRRYVPFWLYRAAQAIDEWDDTPPEEGTSVRAAMDVLRTVGHRRLFRGVEYAPSLAEGISANRWATTVDQVLDCLGGTFERRIGGVGFLNSWGRDYPHIVYMPLETLRRVLDEYGEASIITDR